MEKNNDEKPIMTQLLTQCYDFQPKIKQAKQAKGKTNQDISDATGIPLSHISKFFSGNLANPNVYNAAAVCIYLDVSLDECFGIRSESQGMDLKHENNLLKAENESLKNQLHLANELVQAHEKSIASARKAYEGQRMLLFCAVILIVTLMIIGSIYLTLDINDTHNGFFQDGKMFPIGVVIIGSFLIAIYVSVAMYRNIIKGRKQ